MFENRVLRRVCGPKRDEVTGMEKTTSSNDLYSSPSIVWVIKLRRMRWLGHGERLIQSSGGET